MDVYRAEGKKHIFTKLTRAIWMDTDFFNFTKQSDEVDYRIFSETVAKQNIRGKLGRRIKEYLTKRKLKVVVNEITSIEEDALLGVLQGAVLASLLLIIIISDTTKK